MTDFPVSPRPVDLPGAAGAEAAAHSRRRGLSRRRVLVALALVLADLVAGATNLAAASLVLALASPAAAADLRAHGIDLALAPLVLIGIYFLLGLYECRGASPIERFRLRALGCFLFAVILPSALLLAGASAPVSALLPMLAVGGTVLGHFAEGAVRGALTRRGLWGAPVLIVGCETRSHALAQILATRPELGFRPAAFLSEEPEPLGQSGDALPVFTSLDALARRGPRVEVALLCSPGGEDAEERLARLPVSHILLVQDARDMQNLWLRPRVLGETIALEMRGNHFTPLVLAVKRTLDLAVSLPLAALALPVIALLALGIKAVDPGPAFYVQTRVGFAGRPIRVIKLRSMYRDAEARLERHLAESEEARAQWRRAFKLDDDPRILPLVGRFVRRSSLDELPQLWNVITGEMSLVGPRPFPAYHMAGFDEAFRVRRTSVPPGLTGLWQVSSRSDGDLSLQKAEDLFYIRNWSIWLDLYILLQTVPAVLFGRGAR